MSDIDTSDTDLPSAYFSPPHLPWMVVGITRFTKDLKTGERRTYQTVGIRDSNRQLIVTLSDQLEFEEQKRLAKVIVELVNRSQGVT